MIISINSSAQVSLIRNGINHSSTRITSKREPGNGDCLQFYYKYNTQNTIKTTKKRYSVCTACTLSQTVTERKCPYYDPDTYSIDMRCPHFNNFIGYGKVYEVLHYENFAEIPSKDEWTKSHGYNSIDGAREYYSQLMGAEWEKCPLTVISWEFQGMSASMKNGGVK